MPAAAAAAVEEGAYTDVEGASVAMYCAWPPEAAVTYCKVKEGVPELVGEPTVT